MPPTADIAVVVDPDVAPERSDTAPETIALTDARHDGWANLGDADRKRAKQSTALGVLAGFVPFVCVLWDFGLNTLRAATAQGFASNFYDIQGRAILHGHLSVPPFSFGIESFYVGGRTYMYFPPFPSLLRLPVLLVTDQLDGRLTAPSMLLAWMVLVTATVVLVWNVRFLVRGAATVTRVESALYSVLIASITGGSIVLFQAALPWVYHEVYLWATAFTVATLASLLAFARHPSVFRAVVTGMCALGAILTRTTSGWAMAFALMAIAVNMLIRDNERRGRDAAVLLAAGVVTLSAGIAVNWAKFRHPFMFPLSDQEWTKRSSRRRLALGMNDGSITGPQFFLTSLANYFKPNGIRFVPYFPFVTLPAEPARAYGGAFLDQTYRTGSIPMFMPLLFGSTVWGFARAFRRRSPAGVRALRLPLVGALGITGGVMFYGYLAHRYTSEFLPVLVLGSTIGVVDVAGRVERRSKGAKRTAVIAIAALAAYGGFANAAVSLTAARTTHRGAALETYVDWQIRLGHIAGLVVQGDAVPATGPADQLLIIGDCDALYLATGDHYEPWATVQVRDYHVRITPNSDSFQSGLLPLISFDGLHKRNIILEADGDGQLRLRMGESYVYYPSAWFSYDDADVIDVGVRVDTADQRFSITLNGREVGYFAAAEAIGDRPFTVVVPEFVIPTRLDQTIVGFTLTPEYGPRLRLCEDALEHVAHQD